MVRDGKEFRFLNAALGMELPKTYANLYYIITRKSYTVTRRATAYTVPVAVLTFKVDDFYFCRGGNVFAGFCLFVCLSVSKITQKFMDGSF